METDSTEIREQALSFSFNGNGMEYFKIWIINICLTILTLGIYSAWAKVRTNSYFYGNTIVDNSHFAYLADPKKILEGRIIAVLLFVIYWLAWQFIPEAGIALLGVGALLFPYFLVSAMSFRMRNSAYRNIRFYFKKNIRSAYTILMFPLGLIVLTTWLLYTLAEMSGSFDLMIDASEEGDEIIKKWDFIPSIFFLVLMPALPWLDFLKTRFIIDHTQYGKAKASFSSGVWGFYKVYLITFLVFMGITGIFIGAMVAMMAIIAMIGGESEQQGGGPAVLVILIVILFYAGLFFVSGILKALRSNMINNNTRIGENRLHSHLKGGNVGWIYLSNTIMIILTLGTFIPWARVRMAKYVADCTELHVVDLDSIRSIEQEDKSAFGEEMGEVFDLDLGI